MKRGRLEKERETRWQIEKDQDGDPGCTRLSLYTVTH
jgi:hypothetical protein